MPVFVGAELVLEIKDWAPPQGALGFWGDVAIFVPYVIPGELVKVQVAQRKKNWALAVLVEILKPSAERQKAICPHFTECGGCDYQMLSYSKQLAIKKDFVLKQASRIGVSSAALQSFAVEGVRASPSPLGYRRRVRGQIRSGEFFLSKKNSHERVRIQECFLLHPRVARAIQETRDFLPDGFYEWDLVDTGDGASWINLSKPGSRVARVSPKTGVSFPLYWPDQATPEVIVRPYSAVKDLSFSQVNPLVNQAVLEELRRITHDVAMHSSKEEVLALELYAGAGNLTAALVQAFDEAPQPGARIQVTAIEENPHSVKSGRARFSPERVRWIQSPVEEWLKRQIQKQDGVFDLLLVDPPRAGLSLVVIDFLLGDVALPWVIYMSCDLMTWARDVQRLSHVYEVVRLHGFDMFPQTHHLEILSLLRRKRGV